MDGTLIIEPFYGGSHKQMVDLLLSKMPNSHIIKMPAKKWHWRARTSALYLSQQIQDTGRYRTLFASSVLNLAELLGLRPDLQKMRKILYFHENQLVYPVKKQQDRDFQYGYNQILSCLAADVVVFNSVYNMESFLGSIQSFLKLIPDYRPTDISETLRPKCRVLYFPLDLPHKDPRYPDAVESFINKDGQDTETIQTLDCGEVPGRIKDQDRPLHIVWPHRWEHDKDPETFFKVMYELSEAGYVFNLSVLGEQFTDVPVIFSESKERLRKHIVNWGYQPSKEDYVQILKTADVSVSTALHEFFGVAMLESVYYGCYPLCPNRLVYPEIYPADYLYNTSRQLLKTLKRFCKFPAMVREHKCKVPVEKFLWCNLAEDFVKLFHETAKDDKHQPNVDGIT